MKFVRFEKIAISESVFVSDNFVLEGMWSARGRGDVLRDGVRALWEGLRGTGISGVTPTWLQALAYIDIAELKEDGEDQNLNPSPDLLETPWTS